MSDDERLPEARASSRGVSLKSASAALANRFPTRGVGSILVVTILLLFVVGTYYYFRTTANGDGLQQRNLRELARLASTVEARVDTFDSIIANLNREANLLADKRREESAELSEVADSTLLRAKNLVRGATDAYWRPADGPGTSPADASSNGTDVSGGNLPREEPRWAKECMAAAAAQVGAFFDPKLEIAAAAICVDNLALYVDLEALLGSIITVDPTEHEAFGQVEFFDQVFVAQSSGRIFLSSGSSGIRLRAVPESGGEGADTRPADQTVRTSEVRSVEIGGESYLMFLQPVRIQFATKETADVEWVMGGLVAAREFRSESLALDPTELMVLVLALIFTVLAWPFLRMWKMGGWERIDARNVLMASLCLAVGSGIVALCLVEIAFYPRVQAQVDDSLREVTKQLEANLYAEIGDALDGLHELTGWWDQGFRNLPVGIQRSVANMEAVDYGLLTTTASLLRRRASKSSRTLNIKEGVWTDLNPLVLEQALVTVPQLYRRDMGAYKFFDYPHFEMVTWVGTNGQQVGKWTVRKEPTPLVNVSGREYFRRIRENRHWFRSERPPGRAAYTLDVVRSSTTGETLAWLAIPHDQAGFSGVAALATTFTSVTDPLVPPGVGFAVIEPDGDTLFHYNSERNLQENFFEEADFDPRLRSAVAARAEHFDADNGVLQSNRISPFNVRYMGRDMRMLIAPLRDTPLSVITYFDRSHLRTINIEIVSLTLVFFIVFNVLLLVTMIALAFVGRQTRLRWAWPDSMRPHKFWAVAAVEAVFVVELLLLLVRGSFFEAAPQMPSIFLVPLQALGLGLATAAWGRRRRLGLALATTAIVLLTVANIVLRAWDLALVNVLFFAAATALAVAGNPRWKLAAKHWLTPLRTRIEARRYEARHFVAAGALTFVVVGFLPMTLFFQVVQQLHLELFVRHSQVEIVETLRERTERLNQFYESLATVETTDTYDELRSRRLAFQWRLDVALASFSRICWPDSQAEELLGRLCTPLEWMPTGDPSTPPPLTAVEFGPALRSAAATGSRNLMFQLSYIPFYNEISVATRYLQSQETAQDGWRWEYGRPLDTPNSSEHLLLRDVPGYLAAPASAAPEESATAPSYEVVSLVPRGQLLPTAWRSVFAWLFALPLAAWALAGLVRFQGREAFLIDFEHAKPEPIVNLARGRFDGPQFFVCTEWCDRRPLEARGRGDDSTLEPIDFLSLEQIVRVAGEPPEPSDTDEAVILGVDGVEGYLRSAADNGRLLTALEELVFVQQRKVLLLSPLAPEPELFVPWDLDGRQEDGARSGVRSDLKDRWARLMSEFTLVLAEDSPDGETFHDKAAFRAQIEAVYPAPQRHDEHGADIADAPYQRALERHRKTVRTLVRECYASRPQQRAGLQIAARLSERDRDDAELLEEIRVAAGGYYRVIWNGMSQDERLLVTQVAQGALTTPAQRQTVTKLLQKGLLVREPALNVMNRSFTGWVLGTIDPVEVRAWEKTGVASAWQQMRIPLLLIVVTVAIFLFGTQRQLFNAGLTFLSAVTVGIPAILRMFSAFRGGADPGRIA